MQPNERGSPLPPFCVGQFPWRLGKEGAGTVEAVGAGVDAIKVGDKVVWSSSQVRCIASGLCMFTCAYNSDPELLRSNSRLQKGRSKVMLRVI